jgi:hypothetical protein
MKATSVSPERATVEPGRLRGAHPDDVRQHGAFGGRSAITLTVAAVALVGFLVWENVTPAPMVPLALFKHRNFSGGSLSLTLVQIGNGGLLLVLTP